MICMSSKKLAALSKCSRESPSIKMELVLVEMMAESSERESIVLWILKCPRNGIWRISVSTSASRFPFQSEKFWANVAVTMPSNPRKREESAKGMVERRTRCASLFKSKSKSINALANPLSDWCTSHEVCGMESCHLTSPVKENFSFGVLI